MKFTRKFAPPGGGGHSYTFEKSEEEIALLGQLVFLYQEVLLSILVKRFAEDGFFKSLCPESDFPLKSRWTIVESELPLDGELDSLEIQIITKVDGLVQFLRRAYLDSKIGEREYEKAKTVFVYDV